MPRVKLAPIDDTNNIMETSSMNCVDQSLLSEPSQIQFDISLWDDLPESMPGMSSPIHEPKTPKRNAKKRVYDDDPDYFSNASTTPLSIKKVRRRRNLTSRLESTTLDESQNSFDSSSLWDDIPSMVPNMNSPIRESTPAKVYSGRPRRSVRKTNDENAPLPVVKQRKKRTTKKKDVSISLWDKALKKNKNLAQFIDSYNEQLEKICSTELSIRSEPNTSMSFLEEGDSANSPDD